jgi:predicted RNA methylase
MVGNLIEYRGGAVLDPCCGEGEAIDTLSAALNAPRDKVYAIELERDRTETTRTRLEGAHVMDPCSFFDARVNSGSIAVIWVNPPFDTNVKGGRAEVDFLIKATSLLMPGGVLCYIVPAHVVEKSWQSSCQHLLGHYDHLAVLAFPEEHRPYDEVVVIGTKRRNSVPVDDDLWREVPKQPLAACQIKWQAPETEVVPKLFEKGGLTDAELCEALSVSPLWKVTQLPEVPKTARPPLPLAKGHIALLLASGQLDGTVCPPGEEPHVVRGTATKVEAPPVKTQEVLPDDGIKTTTVIRERIQLVVRAVSRDGNIKTFA